VRFTKYHALGNDYLVVEAGALEVPLTPATVRRVCDRHFGVGADGVLLRQADSDGRFALRIFNPDGSEAEKSGNGLRIFARHLWDRGVVRDQAFTVRTAGGEVRCQVHAGGRTVTVDMGRVSFHSSDIPVAGAPREVLDEPLEVDGEPLRISAATIGNPHCVLIRETVSAADARRLGPRLETHALFPRRTNVQLVQVIDRGSLRLEIWERGAGYTLASGSSSCAAAAVAHRLGLCDAAVQVHMPGGALAIEIAPSWEVRLTGPVTRVAEGRVDPEALEGTEVAWA
jgi:diaminopimelate epimerase